ncbi:hypothetical protein [Colwellia piezophila]|uniref:hypothetical protein n=1 Tax=Colwellia piezophila TaxID=211668 RepID=UPI0003A35AE6|nr:hypothetical protein [Colwellia piezophila]
MLKINKIKIRFDTVLNNQVTVFHDSIKTPKYVRYAWENNPENASLYNDQGLPATPFPV